MAFLLDFRLPAVVTGNFPRRTRRNAPLRQTPASSRATTGLPPRLLATDERKSTKTVPVPRSTERTRRHRTLPTRTPHRDDPAMRARTKQRPRSSRRPAKSEAEPESQAMHVLCTAPELLNRQPLEHEGRIRRAQGRKLLRLLDRHRRGFAQHAGITQPFEEGLRRAGKEIDFFCPSRLGEELSLCHKGGATASTTTLRTDRERSKQRYGFVQLESYDSVRS